MLDSDIKMYLAQEMSDDGTNGGRMSTTLVVSGVAQNVWPHVNKALRDAGNESDGQYRKVFISNQNSDDEPLMNAALIYDGDTLGDDRTMFFPVSDDADQDDWTTGAEQPSDKWASGDLKTDILSTATSLTIVFKDNDQATLPADGTKLYLTNKTTPDAVTGDTAQVTISGAPSVTDEECAVNLTGQVGTAFLASNTRVCMMYVPADDIEPSVGTQSATVAGDGTLDDAQIVLSNQGTIRQTITLTFTSATAFDVTSDEPGVTLASGTISSEYEPINPTNSKPYLTIPVAAWTDTDFALGDEIELPLMPATIPMVQQRIIPVACSSLANNRIRVVSIGESES
jgi:hypothetical protein